MEALSEPSFVYAPLESVHIRLLRIRSFMGTRIQCEIKHVDLHSDLKWYAMSYVWGTAPPSERILVYGHTEQPGELLVTPNLLAGLRTFYRIPNNNQWIWVDAISINQDDDAEKSIQVPHMSHIYQRATMVVVWFGEDPRRRIAEKTFEWRQLNFLLREVDRDTLLEYGIERLKKRVHACAVALRREPKVPVEHLVVFWALIDELAKVQPQEATVAWKALELPPFKDNLLPPVHPFWTALADLLCDEWFHRVWTYQEVKLARRAALLSQDSILIPWKLFYRCRTMIKDVIAYQLRILESLGQLRNERLDCIKVFEIMRETPGPSDSAFVPENPRTLLAETRFRTARNPKDHVYGILGLLAQRHKSAIVVDYGLPTAAVYVGFLNVLLREDFGSLAFLWFLSESNVRSVEGLPSWCPDFGKFGIYGNGIGDDCLIDEMVRDKYLAEAEVECYPDTMMLECKVLGLDHIVRCFDWNEFFDSVPWHLIGRGATAVGRAWVPAKYSKWVLALHESISCDKLARYVRYMHDEDRSRSHRKLLKFCKRKEAHGRLKGIGKRFRASRRLRMVEEDMFSFLACFGGKNVFETAWGRIGVSPNRVCVGDKLMLLPEASSLIVLSSDKRHYRGTAYVENLMKKSLLELPEELEDAWEMVELI